MKSRFLKNFSIYFSGALVGKAIGLFNLLLLGNLLDPSNYATYVIFFLICDMLGVFTIFGFTSGIMKLLHEDKKVILSNSLFIIFILSTAILVITIFLKTSFGIGLVSSFEKYHLIKNVLLFIPVTVFTSSMTSVISTYFNAIEKPLKNTTINIIGSLIFLFSLLIIKNTSFINGFEVDILFIIIIARIVSMIFSGLFALYLSKEYFIFSSISFKKSISIMKRTSVFLTKHIIGIFQTQANLIVVAVYSDTITFGVFAYYNTIISQLSILSGSFFKAYTPRIVNILRSKKDDRYQVANNLVKKATSFSLIAFPVFLLSLYFLIEIVISYQDQLSVFIHKDYIAEIKLLFFMLVVWMIGNFRSFIDIWQYESQKYVNHFILFIQIIALLILYFGAMFFLKKYDINGIVINQFLLYAVVTLINLYCYYRFILNVKKVRTTNDR